MPIETKVEEAVKKNNGVIPMETVTSEYIKTGDDKTSRFESIEYIKTADGTKIGRDQLVLLFWTYAKDDMSENALNHYMTIRTMSLLDYAVFGNFARAFWYRDHARDFNTIVEGKKFCDTLAMQILTNSNVRIAMANKMHDDAMDIYRELDRRLTVVGLITPET
jgi:hypothetical protein